MADPRPFLPSDLDSSKALTRAITAHFLRAVREPGASAEQIVDRAWPKDLIAKAATSPITTSAAAALQPAAVAGFVSGLAPISGAARLMQAGIRVDLEGNGTVSIPRASTNPLPVFVDEGAPLPVPQAVLSNATVGPMKKMGLIEVITGELNDLSTPNAEQVIRTLMNEAAAKALDAAIFSTAAASSSRPAGILAGITPLTATAGGGVAALIGDVKLLVGALNTAGGGARVMVFAGPVQAATLPVYAPGYGLEVVPVPALQATSTVVALDPEAFASAISDPLIEVSSGTTLHLEDTTPLQLATGAQGSGVLATPSRSMFQTNSYAIRLILRVAWAIRAPGLVQFVPSVTW